MILARRRHVSGLENHLKPKTPPNRRGSARQLATDTLRAVWLSNRSPYKDRYGPLSEQPALIARTDTRPPVVFVNRSGGFAAHNNFSDSTLFAPGIMRQLKNAGKMDGVTFIDQVGIHACLVTEDDISELVRLRLRPLGTRAVHRAVRPLRGI